MMTPPDKKFFTNSGGGAAFMLLEFADAMLRSARRIQSSLNALLATA
jgi:hypothetical protein